MSRYVTTDLKTILDAVDGVMACVPRPWTRIMVEDAVDLVLHFADEWRSNEPPRELDQSRVEDVYLRRRLKLSSDDADTKTIVAE